MTPDTEDRTTVSGWRALGAVEPTSLVRSRETLHHAAQLLALVGDSYLDAQPDDSHTSMSWLEPIGALATQIIGANAPLRFALRVRELTLVVVDETSGEESAALPLDNQTRGVTLEWMRREASRHGLDGARLRSRLHFSIAHHPTDDGSPFECATDGTLAELASWYANAHLILENSRRRIDGAGPVRCWPHHFDIATLVRLLPVGELQTIGIGLSPGDESYTEPYYYVAPYPTPSAPPRPLSVGRWHTTGWCGAVLVGSEIVRQPEAGAQAVLVNRFIEEAFERQLQA